MGISRLSSLFTEESYVLQQFLSQPSTRRTATLASTILGFTIVELLIVIVVIGILASIVIVAFNGVNTRANNTKRDADLSLYYKAIIQAQQLTGKNLRTITGSSYSAGSCTSTSSNPSATVPRDLPKTNACWVRYYDNLDKIGAAAEMSLSQLKKGDGYGNPYLLDENEGESGNCANQDTLFYMTNVGVGLTQYKRIPLSGDCS